MAEQEPVEKENIVERHAIEHDKIPAKAAATRNSGRPNRLKQRKIDKRKTLKNNIVSYDYEKIMNVLNKYGLTESVRAEQISEDIFIEIFKSLEC